MRKSAKVLIGVLSAAALIGSGFAVWTVNYGSVTKVEKLINPGFDSEIEIVGGNIDVVDANGNLSFTQENQNLTKQYIAKSLDTSWYGREFSVGTKADLKVTLTVDAESEDYLEYITLPANQEIGYEDWLAADKKESGYAINMVFGYKKSGQQNPKDYFAEHNTPAAEQEEYYTGLVAALKDINSFKFTFELIEMDRSVSSVALDQHELELEFDAAPVALHVTVLPNNASNKAVTWASSNPDVASVSESGIVTPHAEGQATITVSSVSDPTKTDTCSVHVTKTMAYFSRSEAGEGEGSTLMKYSLGSAYDAENSLEFAETMRGEIVGKEITVHVEGTAAEGYEYKGYKLAYSEDGVDYVETSLKTADYTFTVANGYYHRITPVYEHVIVAPTFNLVGEGVKVYYSVTGEPAELEMTDQTVFADLIDKEITIRVEAVAKLSGEDMDVYNSYVLDSYKLVATKGNETTPVIVKGANETYTFTVGEGWAHTLTATTHKYGTVETEVLTAEQFINIGDAIPSTSESQEIYYYAGTYKNKETKSGNRSVYLTGTSNKDIQLYKVSADDYNPDYVVGDVLTACGHIKHYVGSYSDSYEFTSPSIISNDKIKYSVESILDDHVLVKDANGDPATLPTEMTRNTESELYFFSCEEGYVIDEVTGMTKDDVTGGYRIVMGTASVNIIVTEKDVSGIHIKAAQDATSVNVGETLQLTVYKNDDSLYEGKAIWDIKEGGDYATISDEGLLTGFAEGSVTISVLNDDNKEAEITISVVSASQAQEYTTQFNFAAQGYENGVQYPTIVLDDYVTVTFTGTDTGKYYNTGTGIRVYPAAGNKMTISASSGRVITSFAITFTTNKNDGPLYNSQLLVSGVACNVNNLQSIDITASGTSGHFRMQAIEIKTLG